MSDLYQRACELVLHEHGCPAIGGAGDAVPFLNDLRTALATAEAERDAAHNEALEKAAGAVLALVKPCNMVEKDGTKQCISTAPSLTKNDHGRIENG